MKNISFVTFTLSFLFKLTCTNGNILGDQINCMKVSLNKECPNENVTFWFYNKNDKNNKNGYLLDERDQTSFHKAPWIENTKTVLILHGYTKSKSEEPSIWLKPEYMKKGYNIIIADYPKAVPYPCYTQSVKSVDTIGNCTAHFIQTLLSTTKVTLKTLRVIGFSIGAQVAGKAGSYLQKNKITLSRIVGLDPAFPLFNGPNNCITKSTAQFVMIIHTNMYRSGTPEMVGHVDFILNGGTNQPHCIKELLTRLIAFIGCNHNMAPIYYAESINSKRVFCGKSLLIGKKPVIMGEYTPEGASGVYHVTTNKEEPFAKDTSCGY